eukprot:2513246-Amphidinium_carterae.1
MNSSSGSTDHVDGLSKCGIPGFTEEQIDEAREQITADKEAAVLLQTDLPVYVPRQSTLLF